MEKSTSPEVIEKIKTFDRIPFDTYKEMINNGNINPLCKLKTPRTIFFDSENDCFVYLNPYHSNFQKCGEWSDKTQVEL